MVWSPDGRSIVFSAVQGDRQQLYLRAAGSAGRDGDCRHRGRGQPLLLARRTLARFLEWWRAEENAMDGNGPPTTICETPRVRRELGIGRYDHLFAASRGILARLRRRRDRASRITTPNLKEGELKLLLPQMLPGNRAVLFTVTHSPLPNVGRHGDRRAIAHDRRAKGRGAAGADGRYVASGHLVYHAAAAADGRALRSAASGGERRRDGVIADVMQAANMLPTEDLDIGRRAVQRVGHRVAAVSARRIFPDPERSLVWVDRARRRGTAAGAARAYLSPRLSPDGPAIVVWTQRDRNVWVYDLTSELLNPV